MTSTGHPLTTGEVEAARLLLARLGIGMTPLALKETLAEGFSEFVTAPGVSRTSAGKRSRNSFRPSAM